MQSVLTAELVKPALDPLFGLEITQSQDVKLQQWVEMGAETEWAIWEQSIRGEAHLLPINPKYYRVNIRDPRFHIKPVMLIEGGIYNNTLVAIAESRLRNFYRKVIMLPGKLLCVL